MYYNSSPFLIVTVVCLDDRTRVVLQVKGPNSSDYINASHVDVSCSSFLAWMLQLNSCKVVAFLVWTCMTIVRLRLIISLVLESGEGGQTNYVYHNLVTSEGQFWQIHMANVA